MGTQRPNQSTFSRRPAQLKVERIKSLLTQRPMAAEEIAHALCVVHETALCYIRELKARREIHIAKWDSKEMLGKRSFVRAYYALGDKKDAKRPASNAKVYSKRHLTKVKADPTAYVAHLTRKRQWYANKNFKPRADVAAQWLFRDGKGEAVDVLAQR